MTMLDVLWATRRQLDDPRHWWKGGSVKRTDETCVALSLMDNAQRFCSPEHMNADYKDAEAAVAAAAGLNRVPMPSQLGAISNWNDDPRTTHAEVLAALDKAIATEKSREDA